MSSFISSLLFSSRPTSSRASRASRTFAALCLAGALPLVGCGSDGDGNVDMGTTTGDMGVTPTVPATYTFSRDGNSTVNHGGQTTRQVLIRDMVGEMEFIANEVLVNNVFRDALAAEGQVSGRLLVTYNFVRANNGDRSVPALLAASDSALSLNASTYDDLGDANLAAKFAGNDDVTDHRDWDGDDAGSAGPEFEGFTDTSLAAAVPGAAGTVATPEGLLQAVLYTFESQVRAYAAAPSAPAQPLYITPSGIDLRTLTYHLMLSAVNFSQGADDYMDNDVDGKGLLADNETISDSGYTELEHAWDEAFGYFGASADYDAYTDAELEGVGAGRADYGNAYHDTDGDDVITLAEEFNFAPARFMGSADQGSAGNSAPTDYTTEAFLAFRTGRAIIAAAAGRALTPDEMAALVAERDTVIEAWERAYAAQVVHQLNTLRAEMGECGTANYDLEDHARAWSAMKGLSLAFQFNPRSPFVTTAANFSMLQTQLGDAPLLCDQVATQAFTDYEAALDAARALIGTAYGFDAENLSNW